MDLHKPMHNQRVTVTAHRNSKSLQPDLLKTHTVRHRQVLLAKMQAVKLLLPGLPKILMVHHKAQLLAVEQIKG